MSGFKKSGVFDSAEGFKCPECRQKFRCGTKFVVYHLAKVEGGLFHDEPAGWWGCQPCAGIYGDIAGLPKHIA